MLNAHDTISAKATMVFAVVVPVSFAAVRVDRRRRTNNLRRR